MVYFLGYPILGNLHLFYPIFRHMWWSESMQDSVAGTAGATQSSSNRRDWYDADSDSVGIEPSMVAKSCTSWKPSVIANMKHCKPWDYSWINHLQTGAACLPQYANWFIWNWGISPKAIYIYKMGNMMIIHWNCGSTICSGKPWITVMIWWWIEMVTTTFSDRCEKVLGSVNLFLVLGGWWKFCKNMCF